MYLKYFTIKTADVILLCEIFFFLSLRNHLYLTEYFFILVIIFIINCKYKVFEGKNKVVFYKVHVILHVFYKILTNLQYE